jgi:hypothetical protein
VSEPVLNLANWYVNRGSGALGHIVEVNDGFAILEVVHPKWSKFSIPIAEYDTTWRDGWRPAGPEDFPVEQAARPPKTGIFALEEDGDLAETP